MTSDPPVASGQPIPGPSWLRLLVIALGSRGDRAEMTRRLVRQYGDLVRVRLGAATFVLCARPEGVREVLVRQQRSFGKGAHYARVGRLQGDGMVTTEGEEHRRQRQEVQHLFTLRRVQEEAPAMVGVAERRLAAWRFRPTIDVVEEMKRISLANTTRSLFHVDLDTDGDADGALHAIDSLVGALQKFHRIVLPFGELLDRLPLPSNLRRRAARRRLDEMLFSWIDQRAAAPEPRPDDALTAIAAGSSDQGDRRRAARDKLLTLVVAGVETTASALASIWYLLARHPEVEERLRRELDTVLAGRPPGAADLAHLPCLGEVIQEALRLRPPIGNISRRSRCPVDLGPLRVPAGASVGLSQWQIQHDERFFADPDAFRPERWRNGARQAPPEGAYFPFGLGGRRCIGEHFALVEMKLTVAVIAQRGRLVMPTGAAMPLTVSTTVRPKRGLPATFEPWAPEPD